MMGGIWYVQEGKKRTESGNVDQNARSINVTTRPGASGVPR